MSHTSLKFFSASQIASIVGGYRKSIHRLAVRHGWPRRTRGNRFEYAPPGELGERCAAQFPAAPVPDFSRLRRELFRASVVFDVVDMLQSQPALSENTAISAAFVAHARDKFTSVTAIRRWLHAAQQHGLPGLVDHRPGRSGKRRLSGVQA